MMRRRLGAFTLTIVAATAALVGPGAVRAAVPAYHPSRLAHVGDARQMIVVTGRSVTSSYATLRTYTKGADGRWREHFAAMGARIGYAGWVPGTSRRQGTGTTPRGTYPVTTAFGVAGDPGTTLPYTRVDGNDYWVGDSRDPRTYNLFQRSASATRTWRIATAERLAAYPTQYRHAAVIDFNRPARRTVRWDSRHRQYVTSRPVNATRGAAIFLHVNGKGATAGCVSVSRTQLVRLLRWLDPAKRPRIAMAPAGQIGLA
jgi:L,D-peptidoglycan transpeptidase YkuD (ErfK/YbiS/YcfS/YnhG family)